MTRRRGSRISRLGILPEVASFLEMEAARAGSNVEICGLLAGSVQDGVLALAEAALPLVNLSGSAHSFAIDPGAYRRAKATLERRYRAVVALYHSHPHGWPRPSTRDFELPKITRLLSLIFAPSDHRVHASC